MTFDHVTWTSIGNIHSQGASTVLSLTEFGDFQANVSKDIERTIFFYICGLTFVHDLKINMDIKT